MLNIVSGKVPRPMRTVIYGPEGIGKTTLASQFPDPLFIDTEGGTNHLDVKRTDPAPTSWQMLMGYVAEVAADPTVCQTLVIDTADWAERLCTEAVLAKHGKSGIESFGYGKGYTYVREEFARLLDALTDVTGKGINVVVCAHAQIRKFEKPDELGTYDRWELKLSRQVATLVKEWADMVLFCDYETIIVQPDQKTGGHAKAQGGRRVMHAEHSPAWDAKNRVGLSGKLPMDYSVLAPHIPSRAAAAAQPGPSAAATGSPEPQNPAGGAVAASPVQPQGAPPAPPRAANGALAQLRDLMAQSGLADSDVQSHCARKGYCTADTPISTYPEDFAAFLVSDFGNVREEVAAFAAPVPFGVESQE